MPIYEYVCEDCGKRNSFLIMITGRPFAEKCRKCGSSNLTRIMSRFAAVRSEESRLESLADPSKWGDLDENDPKSMVKFMKKMGKEMGEELGEDFDQMIEEAEQEAYKGEGSNQEDDDEL
ncbi:MAG: FmdB family zinc ribbon protein [bacterium]